MGVVTDQFEVGDFTIRTPKRLNVLSFRPPSFLPCLPLLAKVMSIKFSSNMYLYILYKQQV